MRRLPEISGERPITFSFEEDGEKYMIGDEVGQETREFIIYMILFPQVGNYLRQSGDSLYKRYPGLTRRTLTDDERRRMVEMGYSPHLNPGTMTLLLASEVEDILMMIACTRGNSAMVSDLVQVPGLDFNRQDKHGYTAAHLAILKGQTECVRILAKSDRVDWNKRDCWGQTPLYLALRLGQSDIVEIIVQQPNIDYNVKTKHDETLGHAAVVGRNLKCVEILAAEERFTAWNNPDRDINVPIMMALKKLNIKENILNLLLKCPRVDVGVEDENGDNLSDIASKTGRTDIIELIEKRTTVVDKKLAKEIRQ